MIKGIMLINNQVEDVEALATKALLTRAGLKIKTFTLENSRQIKTAYNTKVEVDYLVNQLQYENYDFLILPGGSHVFNFLGKSEQLNTIINYFHKQEKLIGAICAAPLFLNEVDLLKDKPYVSFPDVKNEIDGLYQTDQKVIVYNNIITSKSAGTVYEFVFEIVNYLLGEEKLKELKKSIVY